MMEDNLNMELEARAYDKNGKEVIVPEGFMRVQGKNYYIDIPEYPYSGNLVYRPPNDDDQIFEIRNLFEKRKE